MAELAEGARLLSECGGYTSPRVRIPLSPPWGWAFKKSIVVCLKIDNSFKYTIQLQSINKKNIIQIIWGILLAVVGASVIYNVPQKIIEIQNSKLSTFSLLFLKFSFYFLGLLLLAGGIKKIIDNYRKVINNNIDKK